MTDTQTVYRMPLAHTHRGITIGVLIAVDNEAFKHCQQNWFYASDGLCWTIVHSSVWQILLRKLDSQNVWKQKEIANNHCSHVSVTTDLWLSFAQESYLSLTCHFLSQLNLRVQVCLHAVSFDDNHTGDQIAHQLSTGLGHFLWITCCCAWQRQQLCAGLRNRNIPNIPCLAHTHQHVVHDGCLAQPFATSLTAKARKLVGYYRRSNLACEALHRIQEQLNCPVHKLI